MHVQLICLTITYGDDPLLVSDLANAWDQLSRACHHHAYELTPTTTEVQHLISCLRSAESFLAPGTFTRSDLILADWSHAPSGYPWRYRVYVDTRPARATENWRPPSTEEIAEWLRPAAVFRTVEFDGHLVRNHAKFLVIDHRFLLGTSDNFSHSAEFHKRRVWRQDRQPQSLGVSGARDAAGRGRPVRTDFLTEVWSQATSSIGSRGPKSTSLSVPTVGRISSRIVASPPSADLAPSLLDALNESQTHRAVRACDATAVASKYDEYWLIRRSELGSAIERAAAGEEGASMSPACASLANANRGMGLRAFRGRRS